jgi:IPT/TIG domain
MSRARTLLALLAIPVFLAVAAIPAVAKKAKSSSAPVVKSIRPLKLKIGQRLTIHGSGFIPGKHKDTVVFMGAGKRVVWVKADKASRSTITLILPAKLAALLATKEGTLQPTRLQVRVIARKSGRAFTKRGISPVVAPGEGQVKTGAGTACGASATNPASDVDHDLLPDVLELGLKTDPCNPDSDGDSVADGYEYQSALDLNRTAGTSLIPWPYPGKRPYPNPLDGSDASIDFDGDGLSQADEFAGSKYLGFASLDQIHYSDGKQMTVSTPAPPADGYVDADASFGFTPGAPGGILPIDDYRVKHYDFDNNGFLSDDEQDADGDGIGNWAEIRGFATEAWWKKWDAAKKPNAEHAYTLRPFGVLDWLNPDSDGDGIPDGQDDQDQDGLTNVQELHRDFVFDSGEPYDRRLAVNPFNPCLPNPWSPACTRYIPFESPPTPFEADSPGLPDSFFPDFPAPYSGTIWWA